MTKYLQIYLEYLICPCLFSANQQMLDSYNNMTNIKSAEHPHVSNVTMRILAC